ncbi:MAG: site-specific integrase [Bacteroidota bacterium]|nr:site-specific integrase [Bacteroidota bacterium]
MKNEIEYKIEPLKTFSHGNVTGGVILDTRREKGRGLYPVKYRITFQRKQVYYKTGYDLSKEDWTLLPKAKGKDLKETKQLIISGFDIIESHVKDIKDFFSFEALDKRLGKGKKEFVSNAYDLRIEELNILGQVGTASIYNSAKVALFEFNPNLKFEDVTIKFLENFERHAIESITYSTLSIYLRTLRTLFNIAIRDGDVLASAYPFSKTANDGGYKIKPGSGTKIALTVEQLTRFISYQPPTKAMQRSKDLFMLSFHLGGINIKDLLLLKWKQIEQNELIYVRAKTKNTTGTETKIRIPLTHEAVIIINQWGNQDRSPENRILPFMPLDATPKDIRRITLNKVRCINKHLVLIGEKLNIVGISSYVARHSLATIMKNSGISESFIKETLGHTSIKTTQNYLKSFETDQRREQFEKIETLLKKQAAKNDDSNK